jgi:hypothetical protein
MERVRLSSGPLLQHFKHRKQSLQIIEAIPFYNSIEQRYTYNQTENKNNCLWYKTSQYGRDYFNSTKLTQTLRYPLQYYQV